MGQSGIELILKGLQLHDQRVAGEQERAIQSQNVQSEIKAREAATQQAKDILEQNKRISDAQMLLSQKAADMNHLINMQNLQESVAKTGLTPPGVQSAPAASSIPGGEANFSPVNSQQATSNLLTFPNGEHLNIPTPQIYAQKQADLAEIIAAPGRKTEAAKQNAETIRQVAVEQEKQKQETARQLVINAQSQAAARDLERIRVAGENYRNSVTAGTQLKIANLPYQFFNNLPPDQRAAVTQPSIDAMNNGDMSAEQVHKQFNEKGMAGAGLAVTGAFMSNGGVPPSEKQVAFKQQIAPIISSLPLIQQYIGMLPQTQTKIGGVTAGISNIMSPELSALEKQIEFNIATVAKSLSGDQGQRLQRALLAPAEGGYMPSKYRPMNENVMNFNRLLTVINETIDKGPLAGLPDKQRAHIKNITGLTSVSPLGTDGKPVGSRQQQGTQPTQSQQLPNNTSQPPLMWTPSGLVPMRQ